MGLVVGAQLAVTRERVRQLEERAIHQLQDFEHPTRGEVARLARGAAGAEVDRDSDHAGGGRGPSHKFGDPRLGMTLEEIGIEKRTCNSLGESGIHLVDDLLHTPRDVLLEISNFGKKTLQHILDKLEGIEFVASERR